jgi:hypothetical protein
VVTAQVREKVGWFRGKFVDRRIEYQQWTVEGIRLRELIAASDGDLAGAVTPVQNDWAGPGLAVESLRTLLGEQPRHDWETAMPDGRVALLYCPSCFDLGCSTLTARLLMGSDVVEWRDIAWQVQHEPFELADRLLSLSFERHQYESLLRHLLEVERSRSEQAM